jgi:cyclic pyranopterin monophosphate synthase
MADRLTHLDEKGAARIVDVSGKPDTRRVAVAQAELHATSDNVAASLGGNLKKGDAVAVARVAGIMAAKKTSDLIPLCHPIAISKVSIEIEQGNAAHIIAVRAQVETTGPTGVEMEALTAASVAALTLYDMGKALDKSMTITNVQLLEKSGGKSGDFRRER